MIAVIGGKELLVEKRYSKKENLFCSLLLFKGRIMANGLFLGYLHYSIVDVFLE